VTLTCVVVSLALLTYCNYFGIVGFNCPLRFLCQYIKTNTEVSQDLLIQEVGKHHFSRDETARTSLLIPISVCKFNLSLTSANILHINQHIETNERKIR
jgi:hypothetical protein